VFKLDHEEVVDFYAAQGAVKIPGVPSLDPVRLVDGDRTLQVLKPLPVTSQGRRFEFRSTVLGVYDKGDSGTVVRSEDALVDAASGDVYARNIGSLFYVGQGNWGGPRGPKGDRLSPPKGEAPGFSFTFRVDEQAAHLYRYGSLHGSSN
jgi:peroxisomal enoyl-CoA hydratase 2